MKSIVKTAKTVEEAINEALTELKVDREDVTIEVLEQPNRGFLGLIGSRDAKVQVVVDKDPSTLANEFLKAFFEKIDIDAMSKIERKGNKLYINILGDNPKDMGVIIGKRGKTLDALQYLVSLAVNKQRSKYTRIILDTENYREKRQETLIRLSKKMAAKAKRTGKSIKLEPMNPYERRTIHSTLQKDPYIKTFSEGEEPYRRVVIESK